MLQEIKPTSLYGVVETTQMQWPECFELDQPANDGMRQRLRQGWVGNGHGGDGQIQLLETESFEIYGALAGPETGI